MQWNQLVGISYYTNLGKFSDVAPHSSNRSHTLISISRHEKRWLLINSEVIF